jgi:hypothetical protein
LVRALFGRTVEGKCPTQHHESTWQGISVPNGFPSNWIILLRNRACEMSVWFDSFFVLSDRIDLRS